MNALLTLSVRRMLLAALALVFGLAFAPAASAATVELLTLRAIVTEDDDGDEVRLKISVDGGSESVMSRFMRNGNVWNIGKKINYTTFVRIRLFDADGALNPDDNLGSAIISKTPGLRTALFNLDGAHYVLTYRVLPPAAETKGFILRLKSLRAIKTEDDDGDELRMKIRPDAAGEFTLSRFMRNGNVWALNRDVHFFTKAYVRLYDADGTFNPDDFLGQLNVTSGMANGITRTFIYNLDGVHYVLTYQVLRK